MIVYEEQTFCFKGDAYNRAIIMITAVCITAQLALMLGCKFECIRVGVGAAIVFFQEQRSGDGQFKVAGRDDFRGIWEEVRRVRN